MDTISEKTTLPVIVVAADEVQVHTAVAMADTVEQEREWDGSLFSCCGRGDRHAFNAVASTLCCAPANFAHNIRSALPGRSAWKIYLLVALLIFSHVNLRKATHHSHHVCHAGPHADHELDHRQLEPMPFEGPGQQPGQQADPESLQFLTGATFNPDNLEPEDVSQMPEFTQDGGFTIMVKGKPIEAEGLFSLDIGQAGLAEENLLVGQGRKLLHKHSHKKHDDDEDDDEHDHDKHHKHHDDDDHDDDDEHDHHDDDHHDDNDSDDDEPEFIELSKTFETRADDFEDRKGPGHGEKGPRDDQEGPKDGPKHGPKGHKHAHLPEDEMKACFSARFQEQVNFWVMEFCWGAIIVYGFLTRKAIRKQLNIKGSALKDYAAWAFCPLCALCQETRTITKNNVLNGVWHNPTVFIAPVQQAPVAQKMDAEAAKKLEV